MYDLAQKFGYYVRMLDRNGKVEGITVVYSCLDAMRRLAREHSGRTHGSVELVAATWDGKRWQPGEVVGTWKNGATT